MHVQGLIWFSDGSRTKQRTKVGIYGSKTRLFFSMSKEIYRRRFWKEASLSIRGSAGKLGGGDSLPWTLRDR